MIVREIKNADKSFFDSFDYFNDFKDTLSWARQNCPEKVPALVEGDKKWNAAWIKETQRRINEKSS